MEIFSASPRQTYEIFHFPLTGGNQKAHLVSTRFRRTPASDAASSCGSRRKLGQCRRENNPPSDKQDLRE